MTYLSERLLARILFDRWNATSRPPTHLLRKWLQEILNEEELLPDGRQAVLYRATAQEKRRVIQRVMKKIEDHNAKLK
jgi:hypothetical protein